MADKGVAGEADPGLAGKLMAPLIPATGDAAEGGAPQLKEGGCAEVDGVGEDMSSENRSLSLTGACVGLGAGVGAEDGAGELEPKESPANASKPVDELAAGFGAEEVDGSASAPKSSKSMRFGC